MSSSSLLFPSVSATIVSMLKFGDIRAAHQDMSLFVTLRALWRKVRQWRERAKSRRYLATMSDRDRKDVGLSRVDAWRELQKPFWEE